MMTIKKDEAVLSLVAEPTATYLISREIVQMNLSRTLSSEESEMAVSSALQLTNFDPACIVIDATRIACEGAEELGVLVEEWSTETGRCPIVLLISERLSGHIYDVIMELANRGQVIAVYASESRATIRAEELAQMWRSCMQKEAMPIRPSVADINRPAYLH